MTFKPAAFAFSRAPSATTWPNSALAEAIAIVVGFGFCAMAVSKNPLVKAAFGLGPVGIIEKNLG